MRKRVVFPEPEGPRKTRNSPSRVSRSTSLTAPSSPCLNTLVSFRVSTTAIQSSSLFKSFKDALVLGLSGLGRILGSRLTLRNRGKHGRDYPTLEGLFNCRGAVTGIADVGCPAENI